MSLLQDYTDGLRLDPSRRDPAAAARFYAWVLQAARSVKRPDLREEIAATVVLRLVERTPRDFEELLADAAGGERRLKGYVRRMISNLEVDCFRREARLEPLPDDDRSPGVEVSDELPEAEIEAVLLVVDRVAEACIARLNPSFRAKQATAWAEANDLAFGRVTYDALVAHERARDPEATVKTVYDRLNRRHNRARETFQARADALYANDAITEEDHTIFTRFVQHFLPQRAPADASKVSARSKPQRPVGEEGEA